MISVDLLCFGEKRGREEEAQIVSTIFPTYASAFSHSESDVPMCFFIMARSLEVGEWMEKKRWF
jgi:hypothetical protein